VQYDEALLVPAPKREALTKRGSDGADENSSLFGILARGVRQVFAELTLARDDPVVDDPPVSTPACRGANRCCDLGGLGAGFNSLYG
jgi:hypothetical protein